MKLLIILSVFLAVYVQVSVQLPAKPIDRKILPLPIEDGKALKAKIDSKQPQEDVNIENDDSIKDKVGVKADENTETPDEPSGKNKRGFIKKILDKIGRNYAIKNRRDTVVVEEVYVYDDTALTDEELVDLVLLEAAADVVILNDYPTRDIWDTEDMTEFGKREKRWSFRKSLKKRIKEILEAVSKS